MKKKIIFNIDRLKICYKQPSGLFENLSKLKEDDSIQYGDFMLKIGGTDKKKKPTVIQAAAVSLDDGKTTDVGKQPTEKGAVDDGNGKKPTEIEVAVVLNDESVFGHICFNGTGKYDGLCFLEIENAKLYDGDMFNILENIEKALSLKVNSLTQVDVALDINFNPIPKIRKLIKDYAQYDMIVNGKKVEDENRTIENYGEYYSRSRVKRSRTPTLYFTQAMSDGLRLRVYNKAKEIAESSGKTYITKANGFDGYRMEVTVRWEQMKQWLDYLNSERAAVFDDQWKQCPNEDFYHYLSRSILHNLGDSNYQKTLWYYCVDRLIYFRRGNTMVSLIDIAFGVKFIWDIGR